MVTLLRCFLSLALALVALAGPALAGVIVVDSAGGGDFLTITDAVDAAVDGDTLLVRNGPYTSVVVTAKSLAIVGDPGRVAVAGISVTSLGPSQRLVLRGFSVTGGLGLAALHLANNDGTMWIEDCDLTGGLGPSSHFGCSIGIDGPGGPGLDATDCGSVVVLRSQLTGGKGHDWFQVGTFAEWRTDGGPGVRSNASSVALYECSLTGGQGGIGTAFCGTVGNGGDACQVTLSDVLLSGCGLLGGAPGTGAGAVGGDGLSIDAVSLVHRLESAIAAGSGGTAVVTGGGALVDLNGLNRSFALTSPLREGEAGTLAMQGAQSDIVAFFLSFGGSLTPMPARHGWFLLGTGFLAGPFPLGAITDPGGTWNLSVTGPPLPAAMQAHTFMLQAYFQHTGGVTLGSGTAFTLVDGSF